MPDLDETLWKLCRKLPTDLKPYGDRDTAEPADDCSCGCVHFLPLAVAFADEWGVCANPKSPRAGLLTFEKQGCPEFDDGIAPETPTEPAPAAAEPATDPSSAKSAKKLQIDFDDFQLAIEGDLFGGGAQHFLDTETGEVLMLWEDADDYDEMSKRLDSGPLDRYLRVECMESHESFRIMQDFANSLPQSRHKEGLLDALTRHKPFRHFKDVVHSDLGLRAQWFAFQENAQAHYVRDWLQSQGIEADVRIRRHRTD